MCTCSVSQSTTKSCCRTQNHILETSSHFTPQLSICAPRDLTTNNPPYTASLLEGQRPTLEISMKISFFFFSLFSSWIECLLVLGWCPPLYVTIRTRHIFHAFQGSAKQTLFPSAFSSQAFRFKDRYSKSFLPFIKGFMNGRLQ